MNVRQRLRDLRIGSNAPGYEAGIDGVRSIALAAVLCFHAEFGWAKGGYLGVSLFFTLSGYLITSLLLGEAERHGRIDLRRFWTRRLRRLAPASRICVLVIAACAPFIAASAQPLKLRNDIIASIFSVANWRFLWSGQSYADMFVGGPSPVLHFWSLAIEEQFYFVYPAIIAAAVGIGRRLRRGWMPALVIGLLAAASVAASVITADHDIGYYGTHLRAAELLIGGLAAYVVGRVELDRLRARPRLWTWLGSGGVILFLVVASTVAQSGTFLTSGGFAALAVVWCFVILGALVPGPLRVLLSTWPLVAVGKLSFSLYLFHWPVYLVLTPDRTGLSQWPLFTLRVVVSFIVAGLSYVLVETPVRTRKVRLDRWVGAAAWTVATLAVIAVAWVQLRPGERSTFDQMIDSPDSVVTFTTDPSNSPSTTTTLPRSDAYIVVVGSDRSGLLKVQRLASAAGATVRDLTDPGCSILDPAASCPTIQESLIAGLMPDDDVSLVVVALGHAEHRAAKQRVLAGGAAGSVELAETYLAIETDMTWMAQVRAELPDVPLLVLDSDSTLDDVQDPVTVKLQRVITRLAGATLLDTNAVTAADLGLETAAEPTDRLRVLVIGDSSSYGVALSLDELAGDRMELMWAGLENCPLAPVVEIRWWEGAQWTLPDCIATQQRWPSLIASFQPQVLVVAESLPEHSEQRYEGDDTWYVAGDQRFIDEHDAAMQRLVDQTAAFDTQILVVDSAMPFGVVDDRRIATWNAYIATWPTRFPRVSLVGIGSFVTAAESAAGRSLRPDGIHLDDATLRALMRQVFVPAVDAAGERS